MTTLTTSPELRLFEMQKYGIKLDLKNISSFLDELGNPHSKFNSIHIAGSNGKGSTASFLASILTEAGYKVGLYTSPHFISFTERIRVNGREIGLNEVEKFLDAWEGRAKTSAMTFFEFTTALAFYYFAAQEVDFAVIETGLGGRLDATNVIQSKTQIITSISLEHTEYLGRTVEEIAFEKAGIIKDNSRVLLGQMSPEAEAVFERVCAERHSVLTMSSYYLPNYLEKLSGARNEFPDWHIPLPGEYQQRNAALAAYAAESALGISEWTSILNGIVNVKSRSGITGRFEIFWGNPTIVLDSAHNPEGMLNFVEEFQKQNFGTRNKRVLFAAMKDKNISEMLQLLAQSFDTIFVTGLAMDRAATAEEIAGIAAANGVAVHKVTNPRDFITSAVARGENECIAVCGSMYLIGEMKAFLKKISN